ncbi:hypothetical protein D1872_259460 [compost metagenome]
MIGGYRKHQFFIKQGQTDKLLILKREENDPKVQAVFQQSVTGLICSQFNNDELNTGMLPMKRYQCLCQKVVA